ncbi:YaiI/YqxD family protein [Alicyclobacillus dauci]|uniref:DUF188 domain-containing protein n=1 Tax=Alicyclobacillus dauci TaxID=1475485 RepID=A0ABY6YZN7_9BACL|nr:DUF188 domain-containing protein [Alicyclobacillus dauci]WAH36098.1 DUF188 domain-containing protein [Alicyclobacillus dauci]
MYIDIFVDADATPKPVLSITHRLGQQHAAQVITVSSINHHIEGENHIQVDASPQATDMEIVRRIRADRKTVVITQDYGLAAMVLARNAKAVSPGGKIYTPDNIDSLLAERAISAKLRRSGKVRMRGPKARTEADNERFERALSEILEAFSDD